MEEKNVTKVSLSTFFLVLAIIAIVVMGIFIYKLNNDKITEIQKSTELQAQVNNLNEKVQNLNIEKNNIKEETDNISKNENSDKNENIGNKINLSEEVDGIFFNEKSGKNSEYYEFFKSEKRVNYINEETLYYGTYNVSENKVTINLTDKHSWKHDTDESINETKVLKFVNNNILQNENNTKYINKNTISGAFVSENSISVGGNSTDEIWYNFDYNGGVRYSDSKNKLYGTYEIKENIITITFYFYVNGDVSVLQAYEGSKSLKLTNDGLFDEEANMNYKRYSDGW